MTQTREDKEREYLRLLEEEKRHREQTKLFQLYPDEGPLSRFHYLKHMEFFAAGLEHQERAFIAANRVGKTMCGCYEVTCHLIGWYPHWWEGFRFHRPITAWAAGEDSKAVRESLQVMLFGKTEAMGTGLIPAKNISGTAMRGGVPDAIDIAAIKHASGSPSRLVMKSYDQGRESFQASAVDVVLLDEEPDVGIYTEALTRTMATVPRQPSGRVLCTFTPLKGLSTVVLSFMPGGQRLEGALPS